MIFEAAPLAGLFIVAAERHDDERGFFATTFEETAYTARGLDAHVAQCAVSFNARRGTLRGLHYQDAPFGQPKLVRCVRGAIYDVVVDIRADSATYGRWASFELDADGLRSLYVPAGFAHGFETLVDDTEVLYQLATPRRTSHERGIRWDDPALAVTWPMPPTVLSPRDRQLPLFSALSER